MTYNFLFNLTFVTDNSSSVPPSCRWWIAYTDDLLYTKFHCVLVFWVTRTRWTTGVQGYFEKASDWVEWRGATAVHHKTSSRQRGNCVVESNTWKEATSCSHWKLNWSHLHNPDNNEKEYNDGYTSWLLWTNDLTQMPLSVLPVCYIWIRVRHLLALSFLNEYKIEPEINFEWINQKM